MSFNYFYNSLPSLNDNQIGKVYETRVNRGQGQIISYGSSRTQSDILILNNIPKGCYLVTYSVPAFRINHVIYASLQWTTTGLPTRSAPNNYFCETYSYENWSNISGTYYITLTNTTQIKVILVAPPAANGYGGSAEIPYENQIWLQAIRIA